METRHEGCCVWTIPASPTELESLSVGSRCFLVFVASLYICLERRKHLNRSTLVVCRPPQANLTVTNNPQGAFVCVVSTTEHRDVSHTPS